jgi:hypothetical protein
MNASNMKNEEMKKWAHVTLVRTRNVVGVK